MCLDYQKYLSVISKKRRSQEGGKEFFHTTVFEKKNLIYFSNKRFNDIHNIKCHRSIFLSFTRFYSVGLGLTNIPVL